jgi:hypothetical protein
MTSRFGRLRDHPKRTCRRTLTGRTASLSTPARRDLPARRVAPGVPRLAADLSSATLVGDHYGKQDHGSLTHPGAGRVHGPAGPDPLLIWLASAPETSIAATRHPTANRSRPCPAADPPGHGQPDQMRMDPHMEASPSSARLVPDQASRPGGTPGLTGAKGGPRGCCHLGRSPHVLV